MARAIRRLGIAYVAAALAAWLPTGSAHAQTAAEEGQPPATGADWPALRWNDYVRMMTGVDVPPLAELFQASGWTVATGPLAGATRETFAVATGNRRRSLVGQEPLLPAPDMTMTPIAGVTCRAVFDGGNVVAEIVEVGGTPTYAFFDIELGAGGHYLVYTTSGNNNPSSVYRVPGRPGEGGNGIPVTYVGGVSPAGARMVDTAASILLVAEGDVAVFDPNANTGRFPVLVTETGVLVGLPESLVAYILKRETIEFLAQTDICDHPTPGLTASPESPPVPPPTPALFYTPVTPGPSGPEIAARPEPVAPEFADGDWAETRDAAILGGIDVPAFVRAAYTPFATFDGRLVTLDYPRFNGFGDAFVGLTRLGAAISTDLPRSALAIPVVDRLNAVAVAFITETVPTVLCRASYDDGQETADVLFLADGSRYATLRGRDHNAGRYGVTVLMGPAPLRMRTVFVEAQGHSDMFAHQSDVGEILTGIELAGLPPSTSDARRVVVVDTATAYAARLAQDAGLFVETLAVCG